MKTSKKGILILSVLVLLQTALGSCGRSAPTRFYTLSPVQSAVPAAPAAAMGDTGRTPQITIGIMPVEIPDYLDRPEIVSRDTSNGLSLAEYDRWAGDLRNDIARILAERLSAQLPQERVFILTGRRSTPADYHIAVQVRRFEPVPGESIWLKAQWAVTEKSGQSVLLRRDSDLREPISGQGYPQTVAAMSRAVDNLGQEMAAALKPALAKAPDSNAAAERR